MDVFAKLFKNCLEWCLEAEALSRCEIGGEEYVLDFRVGHLVDIDLTWQPAPQSAIGVFASALLPTLPKVLIKPADTKSAGVLHLASELRSHLADFVAAYNFAKRLKTLKALTPYEAVCHGWDKRTQAIQIQSTPANAGTKHLDRLRTVP